jgi:hypothetical protein
MDDSMVGPQQKPQLYKDTGLEQRLAILRRDAELKIFEPLRTHGWTVSIEEEVRRGEYLLISAERGGHRHRIALLYSCATDNAVYKAAAQQAEHIFFNSEPYKLESFAYGLDKPVGPASDFHALLLTWNAASSEGKFAPAAVENVPVASSRPKHRVLLSEEPIDAIWLRLRQLQSVTLAKKIIAERASQGGTSLSKESIGSKAEGVAYALRNATDYFRTADIRNVSQRVLNLYYGSMAFAFAEMLASPHGPSTLTDIEDSTKRGHGLYTLDGLRGGLENLVVGIETPGFYPAWIKSMGIAVDAVPNRNKRPHQYEELAKLPAWSWLTIEQLFGRIPEVADLFNDIFESAPGWITPFYDQSANQGVSLFGSNTPPSRSYVQFVDESSRFTKQDIAAFPGPISEIAEVTSEHPGRYFRAAIDHGGKGVWWEALQLHHSPFKRNTLILPIFETVGEYRAICLALLYGLSIVVRYRPSIWRRVQEGDLDHMRALTEAFLAVVERVLPEQFLECITGQQVSAKQPGSFF